MSYFIMIKILTMKYKDKAQKKINLVVCLLELTLMKKILTFLKPWMKYKDIENQLKNP